MHGFSSMNGKTHGKRGPTWRRYVRSRTRELWRLAGALENWIDRMALRLGDAILGKTRSEKIFGPHPKGS
jgi:hypothetical protein